MMPHLYVHARPLSKHKNFVVMEIVKPEHQYDPEKAKALAEEFEQQARQRTRLHGLDMGFAANVISPSNLKGPASWEPETPAKVEAIKKRASKDAAWYAKQRELWAKLAEKKRMKGMETMETLRLERQ